MRISEIQFYRYGMFFDVTYRFPSRGLQVVYGMNEAGKSTMMHFIHDMLFGFSGGSPGISDDGSTFGGAFTLEFPDSGPVRIERTGSKGRGTVKIDFPDGKSVGEEALNELFPGLDEAMFRAIFCFDLDGLAGLEKIRADELNNYLFHAGMTGDFSIRELEKKLAKKKEELFKPRGQKPQLNQLLNQLEGLDKEVGAWQRKNDSYRELVEQTDEIQDRLAGIRETTDTYREKIRFLEKQKVLAPYVHEKHEAKSRLKQLPAYEPFPENGVARFEEWRKQAVTLEAELAELRERRKAAAEKAGAIEVRDEWLRLKAEVQREREQERFMQSRESEKAAQEEAVRGEEEELAALMEQLGPVWTEARIAAADTGFAAKEALKKLAGEHERLAQRREMLDGERERAERAFRESEAEARAAEAKRLAQEERERLEEALRAHEEKRELEDRLAVAGRADPVRQFVFYGGTALGTALVIWMVFNGQWITGLATALLTAAFALYLHRAGGGSESDRLQRKLAGQPEKGIGIEEAEKIKLTLEEDNRVRQSEAILRDRLIQREKTYRDVTEQGEVVREQLDKAGVEIEKWCTDHQFPARLSPPQLTESFERVEEAKMRIRRRDRGKDVCQSIEKDQEKRENNIKMLCRTFALTYDNNAAAVTRMAERIENQENLLQEQKRLEDNLREYDEQIRSMQEKARRFRDECLSLMQEAQTEDEEAYRNKGRAWQESRQLLEQLASMQAKMASLVVNDQEREAVVSAVLESTENTEDRIRGLEEEIKQLEKEVQALYKKQAELNEQKNQLEEGGTYAQLLHQFEQKKDEFHSGARKWAVYQTAESLLKKAKEQYRNQRLPAVITEATEFFRKMTANRYVAIFAPENEGFVVERADGARFTPGQLSRGTAEQLYLALRLALAQIYQSPSPYPLIMDDILVNFDAVRIEKAIGAIREAASHHQVLFFTCHTHFMSYFYKEEMVSIERSKDDLTYSARVPAE